MADEIEVLNGLYQLMRPFDYETRRRMLNWLEARSIADEDKRQVAEFAGQQKKGISQ